MNSSEQSTSSHHVQKFDVGGTLITECQARILSLFIHGLARKQIADALGNSPHTIDTHIDRIYKLLGFNDARLAVVWALSNGFDHKGSLNGQYLFANYKHLPWHKKATR